MYPPEYIDPKEPPACIFFPEKPIMEKIVRVAMKYSFQGKNIMLSKFFDMELEKHAYMVSKTPNESTIEVNSVDVDSN